VLYCIVVLILLFYITLCVYLLLLLLSVTELICHYIPFIYILLFYTILAVMLLNSPVFVNKECGYFLYLVVHLDVWNLFFEATLVLSVLKNISILIIYTSIIIV